MKHSLSSSIPILPHANSQSYRQEHKFRKQKVFQSQDSCSIVTNPKANSRTISTCKTHTEKKIASHSKPANHEFSTHNSRPIFNIHSNQHNQSRTTFQHSHKSNNLKPHETGHTTQTPNHRIEFVILRKTSFETEIKKRPRHCIKPNTSITHT